MVSLTGHPQCETSSAKNANINDESSPGSSMQGTETEYASKLSTYGALKDEIIFILRRAILERGIKIHDIESRVKTWESIIAKAKRKNIENHFVEINDIVGARVICLFRSDIKLLMSLVEENFNVLEVDNKIEDTADSFGYLSVHYIAQIPATYTGPRYDNIRSDKFEIQLRTIAMHSWAVISHYLEYKGDWDVPVQLKRSLNALSGLFYVADDQFEQFYAAREQSKLYMQQHQSGEINLDSLTTYLRSKFPDRDDVDIRAHSELVEEIKQAGYRSLSELGRDLDLAKVAFEKYEQNNPPTEDPKYNAVGVARLSLSIASPKFLSTRSGLDARDRRRFEHYMKYLV